tara:strand:+ start:463 stop:1305 length:843 start_codon:yes stop_codon:yes gene_type:complete
MQQHLWCFGLGYSAHVLATQLVNDGWRVSGTHRTAEKCEAERVHGITAHLFDTDMPLQNVWDLDSVTHVLVSIAPDSHGDPVLMMHKEDLLNLPNLQWVGYLSTTGVYGDHQGAKVDEASECKPVTDRNAWRLNAEQAWMATGLPVHIFRLAGIYGPGRNAIEQLKKGTAKRIDKPGQIFSRIHVEDIANVLRASIAKPNPMSIYNVCDDYPCPQAEVVTHAANIASVEPPPLIPYEEAQLSDMAKSFYCQSRYVLNTKIKEELDVSLHFSTYKEGLLGV